MCSHRLIATNIANLPELNFGQEVLHADQPCLHYDLVDMHKLSPHIDEVMEFQKWLIIKLNLKNFLKSGNSVVQLCLDPPNKYFLKNFCIFVNFHKKP
jgi:hypothetical protein